MKLKALVAGVVGSIVISTSAFAADPIIIPPPAPPPPMVVAPAGYNWGGLYAGAGAFTVFSGGMGFAGVLGVFGAGFNIDNGGLVFGAEAYAITDFTDAAFGVKAKAGFALGDSRRALVYGTFGAIFLGATVFTFGGGAAFALGERLSVFAEVDALTNFAAVACCFARAGVNFHFGN